MSELTFRVTVPADGLEEFIQKALSNILPRTATSPVDEDSIWTVDDICTAFKIPKTKVYDLTMRTGRNSIPRFKVGRALRFKKSEVIAWFDRQRVL